MEQMFYKFDGAGNDFVVIDNRDGRFQADATQIERLCHRRFGVGADGLMTLDAAPAGYDFEMRYYNSDGRPGSMCGNGGRCIAAFAHVLGLGTRLRFMAYDGPHEADIVTWDPQARLGIVRLGMQSVPTSGIRRCLEGWFLDTGSPHYVQRVAGLEHYDVVGQGRRLRHLQQEFPEGTNVDFIEDLPDGRLAVRTYERGVEDETWACGTGVTAAALVSGNCRLVTRGGDFKVDFEASDSAFNHIFLTGPVALNFTGTWTFSAQ
ncbi:MAG: diaminopimelate epimerase [Bacteroidales bacterium]|nr:diaminopimelate epimerase [Bacteroidales bacterium]